MNQPNSHVEALRRAVEIAGSQEKLASGIAKFLNRPTVSQQTVSYWLREAVQLGPEWWPAIEHVTDGKVTRAHLRPDVFSVAA